MREVSPHLLTASTVMGNKVANAEGEDLGELKEIVIDSHSGRVAYAVLGFGGFLGLGEKYFAVPWEALKVSPAENRLYLDISKDLLRDAPGFDKAHWPSSPDREFESRLYAHYGYKPYWEDNENARADTADVPSQGHALRHEAVTAYSGADMSGGAGLHSPVVNERDDRPSGFEANESRAENAYSGAGLEDSRQSVSFTSAEAENTSVFSSTSPVENASHETYGPDYGREGEKPLDAGIDDRLRDTGGSPARGYGRGGINAPEDLDASMNPGADAAPGRATDDRSERDAWAGAGAFGGDASEQRSTTMNYRNRPFRSDDDTRKNDNQNNDIGGTGGTTGIERGSVDYVNRSDNEGERNRRDAANSMTEAEQRALGEQAADEFNPGLTGSISDIDSSRSGSAGTIGGAGYAGGNLSTYSGGEQPPANTRAFEEGEELPAGQGRSGDIRSMSGASGLSSTSSTGGSEGMSAAEDLEIGTVDDLNVLGTNLGEGYPADMTVTEDLDSGQPNSIRPGTRRGSSVAGDESASTSDLPSEDRDVGGSGSGRGHSSGSSSGDRHRGSRSTSEGE